MRPATLLTLLAALGVVTARSAPPQVASTQPSNGASGVKPGPQEIVVAFDQEMDPGGFSFTGAGPAFPKLRGQPSWRDARQCVLPVDLDPDHAYEIGINSQTHKNFRSAQGEPVSPAILRFSTGPAAAATPNAAAALLLNDLLEHRYSHRQTRGRDWPSLWTRSGDKLAASGSAMEFATAAGELLAATQDPHIWLRLNGQIVPAFRRNVTPNVDPAILPRALSKFAQLNRAVASGWAAPRIGYLAIHSWARELGRAALEPAFQALDKFRDAPALVLDLRLNSGGDESIAREFAARFVPRRALYARVDTVNPSASSGFDPPTEHWIEPSTSARPYTGRVALLIGPANMSSAEAFILMMKQSPAVTLVGQRTSGSSGNPQPHDLGNGVTVVLPSWREFTPDGTAIETVGIGPDVEAQFSRGQTGDPVLAKAVEILSR